MSQSEIKFVKSLNRTMRTANEWRSADSLFWVRRASWSFARKWILTTDFHTERQLAQFPSRLFFDFFDLSLFS